MKKMSRKLVQKPHFIGVPHENDFSSLANHDFRSENTNHGAKVKSEFGTSHYKSPFLKRRIGTIYGKTILK